MAKRKAARTTGRKGAAGRAGAGRSRSAARKGARKKTAAARKSAPKKGARKAAARKAAPRKTKQAARPKAAAKTARTATTKTARTAAAPRKTARPAAKRAANAAPPARKAPALDRPRRTIADTEDLVPTPPSSLDLDRSASAVRSGRRGMSERYAEHTETSPALTGGDVDADWEGAYSAGDEAPGGDNPTPDQDIVDDIGRAVGVEYEDNEELKGEEKIAKRDRKRWELDPASSEDYPDRD